MGIAVLAGCSQKRGEEAGGNDERAEYRERNEIAFIQAIDHNGLKPTRQENNSARSVISGAH